MSVWCDRCGLIDQDNPCKCSLRIVRQRNALRDQVADLKEKLREAQELAAAKTVSADFYRERLLERSAQVTKLERVQQAAQTLVDTRPGEWKLQVDGELFHVLEAALKGENQ